MESGGERGGSAAGRPRGRLVLGVPAVDWCRVVLVAPRGVLFAFALSSRPVAGWVVNDDGGLVRRVTDLALSNKGVRERLFKALKDFGPNDGLHELLQSFRKIIGEGDKLH